MDHLTLFELGRVINNAPKFHNFSYFYMTYLKSKKNILVFHNDFGCIEGGGGEHPPAT